MAVGSDDESTIKVSTKKDKQQKSGTIKLKKPAPKHRDPGNWKDDSVVDDDKKKGSSTPLKNSGPASPASLVNQLDDLAKETFPTGRPLEDAPELYKCNSCNKAILKSIAKKHGEACAKRQEEKKRKKKEAKDARERAKREEQQKDADGDTRMESGEDDDDASPEKKAGGLKSTKKSAGKKVEVEKSKKRKADGDAEKGPKAKKKKEEVKPKQAKPKGPVDVERQCGVLIKEGVRCARSLTCKSHSMGAKRAVGGRSLPYDMLLAAYQKKNQAKQQKAAIDANAPLEDEDAALGPVDSDEELTAVMQGLSNWNPQPLVPPLVQMPIEREYQKRRLYEQLHNATNGFTINIFKVEGYGAQKLWPGHPGYVAPEGEDGGEVVGDGGADLSSGMQGVVNRRASNFQMSLPPRRPSATGR